MGLLAACGVLILFAGAAVRDLVLVAGALDDGRSALERAASTVDDAERAAELAESGAASLDAAQRRARSSPWLGMVGRVPVIGRQVAAVRDVADAAATAGSTAERLAGEVRDLVDEPLGPGKARLVVLGRLADALREATEELGAIEVSDRGWLLPPLGRHRSRLADALEETEQSVADGARVLAAVADALSGPSDGLVLAASNSEMRSTGMPLHVSRAMVADGAIDVDDFVPARDLRLDGTVPVPPEINDLYGWLSPGREWRNTTTSPNFPVVAPMYATMAQRSGLGEPRHVVLVDLVALAGLVDAIGGIELFGIPLDGDGLLRGLTERVYIQFPNDEARRDAVFADVAAAILTEVNERPVDASALLRTLRSSVRGRHLLVWSADDETQDALEAVGASGSLRPDGILVTVQNHTGNKLDPYIEPSIRLRDDEVPDGVEVTIEVTIANEAPDALPAAVDGSPVRGHVRGTYEAMIAVHLPAGMHDVVGEPGIIADGVDGPMRVVLLRATVPRGDVATVTVTGTLDDHQTVSVIPSARLRPVRWVTSAGVADDDVSFLVPL